MKNKIMYWLTGVICLLAGSIVGVSQADEIKSPLPVIKEGTLANGLRYTLVPLEGAKTRVDIRLIVDVGSIDENDNESGVAHMVEHMVFRATDTFPQGVGTELHKQGWVRAQHYNAMTNYERTMYMMSPPKGNRDLGATLQALSQMTGHAKLLQSDLDDERKIILEEWRGKLGVAERMNQQRVQAIRHDSRYPSRPTIGTEASINETPARVLQDFYQRWYRPSNMRLMIIGDITPADAERDIQRYFAPLPDVAVPAQDYYEPLLKPRLKVARLQDSQSGSSQVSFVYRFNDKDAFGQSEYRHRLLTQITMSAVTRQVRRQQAELPQDASSLVVRKSDIGKTTAALGFFANVMPGGHDVALSAVLKEIERLKRYPLNEQDITEITSDIREVAQRMSDTPETREFADWVQQLTIVWQQDRPYVGSQQRGKDALEALDTITVEDVNRHLQRWLASPDTLVQFSVPGATPFTLPKPDAIIKLQKQWTVATLTPLQVEKEKIIPELPSVTQSGKRTAVKTFAAQKVEQWQLSNGDRVVWLRVPEAGKKVYLTATSQAGFMADTLNPWQAQLASQLVNQSGPATWSGEALSNWKKEKTLSLSIDQGADQLTVSGTAPTDQLASLFGLYRELNVAPGIDPDVMKESMMSLARQKANDDQSVSGKRTSEITKLRFGGPTWQQPDIAELKHVSAPALLSQWHKAAVAPVTYYLIADMPAAQLLPQVERYLATIPRQPASDVKSHLALPGKREATSAINIEPRADILTWSFTPHMWTPQAAVQVSIARNIASKYLKTSLRDDALGIYRMRVDSELEDKKQRIETEVSFTSAPERAQELWTLAEQAFAELPSKITQQDVDEQKAQFIRAEKGRQSDLTTIQRRLLLSYRHYDDPRYLSSVSKLADSITLEGVRGMSAKIYNSDNRVLYIALPQEVKE
ncbi:M16 family metallopeptidase [Pectobacterium parmentieri]|uniref:Insulinase family protein n=1 Tax=Pectobacterium parmentieri TaxID=1905730 RepID=A0A8B3F9M0_PECPM|nr:M16 family metallopeptidase [Pectobacterium parmentieri]AOR59989.1 peptidase M16 [Pectobacterium parmentieri]AYH09030.1 insulinase family protein [Pectobacterium parmentieri]AYH35401.1 insulinase family protein [Pectobacterium parmentieri]AZS55466.1 insulinase family protein [Pectobacterium parmentieri]MBI0429231.1 insulinase family protein [Pectobacterium parmentieri]